MVDESPSQKRVYLAFAERFEDLLSDKLYAVVAFGALLSWIWMSLVKGNPAFMNGEVDDVSVGLVLGSFTVALLAFALVRSLDALLSRRALWLGAGGLAWGSCLFLMLAFYGIVPLEPMLHLTLVRCLMVVLGVSSAILVECCAVAFACLRPASAAVGFFFSCVIMATLCGVIGLCKSVGGRMVEGALFCLLPLFAAMLLVRAAPTLGERLALLPEGPEKFAKGYREMCLAFGVFFFALSAKAAMEPSHEFHSASDISFAGILVLSFALFYCVGIKRHPVGVFRLLKIAYGIAVLVLTVCVALAPLSLDPYLSIAFHADCMVLIMVLWLLVAFVGNRNEVYVCKVVGIAFASAAFGLVVGWLFGEAAYAFLGHSRGYISVGIACATAVFSTMGFSSSSFPYLTTSGKGAQKMQRAHEPEPVAVDYNRLLADEAGLSAREYEVFELLMVGHNATSVASELTISYHTARSHVRNIYAKLNVHSRTELLEALKEFSEQYDARQQNA